MSGVAVTVGQFGTWTPIGVEKTWAEPAIWSSGSTARLMSTPCGRSTAAATVVAERHVSGTSAEIQSLEPGFNQNLNGVGGIPPSSSPSERPPWPTLRTSLSSTGSSLGPQIWQSGALVTVGQFGAYTPIAAEATASGYQVAWKNGALDEYIVWNIDGSGNWLSQGPLSGASPALKAFENTFNQDLNLNGVVGAITSMVSGSTDEIGPVSSGRLNFALFTSHMASAFATPAGEGTGVVADPQSLQPFLARPFA